MPRTLSAKSRICRRRTTCKPQRVSFFAKHVCSMPSIGNFAKLTMRAVAATSCSCNEYRSPRRTNNISSLRVCGRCRPLHHITGGFSSSGSKHNPSTLTFTHPNHPIHNISHLSGPYRSRMDHSKSIRSNRHTVSSIILCNTFRHKHSIHRRRNLSVRLGR